MVGPVRNKLILGFGALILVLLANIVLSQIAARESTATYNKLRIQITPTMAMLDEYQEVNRELLLLTINKILRQTDEEYNNRMKAITEVALPHFKNEIFLLKQTFATSDNKTSLSNNIIALTDNSIKIVKDINNLLLTSADYDNPQKVKEVTQKANLDLSLISQRMDQDISLLQKEYHNNFDVHQNTLSEELDSLSSIIFFIALIGNVLGISIAWVTLQRSFAEIKVKNKELEQFVYIASHDLQEPLRTLSSFVKLLEKEYPTKKGENSNIYLRFIDENATRMSQLIKGLLDYSRIGEAKKVTDVDCNVLIRGIKEDLSLAISKTQANITTDDLPVVKGYETELRLLFQNLISNAIKFHILDKPPCISISVEKLPRFWKFAVKDDGIGIDARNHKKIFNIFQRLNNRGDYKGTGIGLAHCRKIVEMHGGKIWVDSVPKVGSTFYFTVSKRKL